MLKLFWVALVALEHVYFLYLEMFLWTKPKGLATFGNTIEKAQASAVLAANQGLYNGFLAAGLIWGLLHPNPTFGFQPSTVLACDASWLRIDPSSPITARATGLNSATSRTSQSGSTRGRS